MPDTITPPNTSAPTPRASSSGAGGWISQHKGVAIGGGIALLVAAYLIFRSRSSSSSSNTSNTTQGTPATVYPTSSGITGDNNAGDYYAGILNQLDSNDSALSSQLTGLSTAISSLTNAQTAASNPATGATNSGSPSASAAPSGPTYSALSNPSDLQALTSTNTPLFYAPTPGVYEQVGDQPGNTTNPELAWIQNNLPGGTGIYVQTG